MTCTWLAWVGVAAALAAPPETSRYEFTQVHMGVPFTLLLYAADETLANRAAEAAFARIEALDGILSDYDPQSELMRLGRTSGDGRAVEVSGELFQVLARSQEVAEISGGAFDVTVGPLVRLWRRARRQHELPSDERIAEVLPAVGYRHLRLEPDQQRVALLKPNMRLDLGGIAKGYAADEALAVLREHGIARALVDASGDISAGQPPPGRDAWQIGIAPREADGPPSRFVHLANAAVATSGDAFQFVELAGRRYSHIIDPRSGRALTDRASVTVIAADCMTADALASAVSVLGPEAGLRLVDEMEGTAALVVRRQGDVTEAFESRRWIELARETADAAP